MPQESRAQTGRVQRGLAYFAMTLIGLSVVAIVVIMIIGGAGVKKPDPSLAIVYVFPFFALPIGFLSVITLLVMSMIQRRKLNSGQAK